MPKVMAEFLGIGFAYVVGFALLSSILWFLGSTGNAHACSCTHPNPPLDAVQYADTVFSGRAVSVLEFSGVDRDWAWSTSDPTIAVFDVNAVWKGPAYDTMQVVTPRSGVSCGFTFVEGEEYLVYAQHKNSPGTESVFETLDGYTVVGYTVSLCSRTVPLEQGQEDLKMLGLGHAPIVGLSGPLPEIQRSTTTLEVWSMILVVGVLLALVGGAMAIVRTRRR